MEGQLRAYVWAHAAAASVSTNHPADQAAEVADQVLAQFDARTFEHTDAREVAERERVIVRLEGELEAAREQNEKDTQALIASAASVEQVNKAAQFDQLHGIVGPLALPNETDVEVVERLAKLL